MGQKLREKVIAICLGSLCPFKIIVFSKSMLLLGNNEILRKKICKKARLAGDWKFPTQLTNKFMQNNFYSNRQPQKQPAVVAMLPKANSLPVFSYFCFEGYFVPFVPQGRTRQSRLVWAL